MLAGLAAMWGNMPGRLERNLTAVAGGMAVLTLVISNGAAVASLRERLFDAIASFGASSLRDVRPIVIDIDRSTIARIGPWPWSRDKLARLIGEIAAAGPKAVALDILLDGPDQRSPAALARSLADVSREPDLRDLSRRLPDGDPLLAAALERTKAVLGVAIDPQAPSAPPDLRQVLVQGNFDARELWQATRLAAPPDGLVTAAAGLGSLALVGDADGHVRHAPMLTLVGGRLLPGLAVELLRVAAEQPLLVLDGPDRVLRVGDRRIPVGRDGLLRLVPHAHQRAPVRRFSAARIVDRDGTALAALKNAAVIIGGSAPELGGLRTQADGSLVGSVELQADAYAQLAAGVIPSRPPPLQWGEAFLVFLACVLGVVLARYVTPVRGVLIVTAAAIGWVALAVAIGVLSLVLVDPAVIPVAGVASFALASLFVASDLRQRASRIRARFEQHLAPAVVRRIADAPDSLRLKGELREVTALFTDIEGFTSMTERADPSRLIEALDGYFDGITAIVVAQGGLVDKIVGDAVHALFNVPYDVPDHSRRALECAVAIERFARDYAMRSGAISLGFGRTRMGLETGPAIVGDVGGDRKLDYTAHGSTINTAARLEQANKVLGTTICVGPGAAANLSPADLMPLGRIPIRGLQEVQVFTVWPPGYEARQRARYSGAMQEVASDPDRARALLADMAGDMPDDPILVRMVERLGA